MPKQELAIVPVYRQYSEPSEIDWDQVLINASIAALQGIQIIKTGWEPAVLQSLLTTGRYDALWARVSSQETSKIGLVADALPDLLADRSVAIGKALVRRLQSEICPEISTEVSEPSPERFESRS